MKKLFIIIFIAIIAIVGSSFILEEHAQKVIIYRDGKEIAKRDSVTLVRCIGNNTIVLDIYPDKEEYFVGRNISYKTEKSKFTYVKEEEE